MTDRIDAIRDDLAFMRAVSADSEPAQSRKGGLILLTAGLVFGAASLAAWCGATGRLPFAAVQGVWFIAMAVFFVALVAVLTLGPRSQGVRDRATGMAWAAMGGAIFTTVIGFQVAANVLRSPQVFAGLPTLIVALYGAGWTVSGAMSGQRWRVAVALGGYVAAVLLAFLVASPVLYLAYALALFALAAVPGLVLLRRQA